ncbi:MAG: DegT/DnrJ/EryC1/StrS family aminotransferase [Firmicutes bacterium]|nr:DegT/DnrJ/EryC1/StrS family aminotransferase [Bacillota bacterium]HQD40671.1 DegT/DnrJ/EryC1/StrS family aminotransferase [Bacillota bacterium]
MEKLAIHGGRPVREKPFPPRVIFGEEELAAALDVIEKTMTGDQALDRYGGRHVDAYEQEFAEYFGAKYATSTSSGTAAVHTAIAALGLEPLDEVITTPITDPGTVAAILFQNCIPVFADVDYNTLNITAEGIEGCLSDRTKAIVVVHLAGQSAEMEPILELARRNHLYVIEDCAQAHGAKYRGKYVGTMGDLGAVSLMSSKHTTSGGQGGMVLTNCIHLYWQAKRFADRGKPFNSQDPTNLFLGNNYRMTELEAAIGRAQLKKLESIKEKRQWIVRELKKRLAHCATSLWKVSHEANPWFCFLRFDAENMNADKVTFAEALAKEGIPVGAHYVVPIYQQTWIRERRAYGSSGYPWSDQKARPIDYTGCCPVAEKALSDHFTLYIHEGWGEEELEDTVRAIEKVEAYYRK